MRIALVSPYSWTYPGGVTRHIEALAGRVRPAGPRRPRARPLRPRSTAGRRCCTAARGPQARDAARLARARSGAHDRLAVQRRRLQPRRHAVARPDAAPRAARGRIRRRPRPRAGRARRRLGRADAARTRRSSARSTATRAIPQHKVAALLGARRKLNRLHVRIAVSEAAAWTGRRFYGGRYRDHPQRRRRARRAACRAARRARPASRCASPSSARPSSARACRVLLRAFEALREHVPAELIVIGATARSSSRCWSTARASPRSAASTTPRRSAALRSADLLVRPVARRRELRHGPHRGLRRRHAGRRLGHRRLPRRRRRRRRRPARPARRRHRPRRDAARPRAGPGARAAMARRRRARAPSATPGRGSPAGPDAPTRTPSRWPAPEGATERAGVRLGAAARRRPGQRRPARRLPSLEPRRPGGRGRLVARARRSASPALATVAGSYLALQHIGLERIGDALVRSSPAVGARRPRPDVRLDGAARRLLARDPERRAARGAAAPGRRPPGHLDRRADVRHAARRASASRRAR